MLLCQLCRVLFEIMDEMTQELEYLVKVLLLSCIGETGWQVH